MNTMNAKTRKKKDTLWSWICRKLIVLAVGSMFLIAFCMWAKYYLENKWIESKIPIDIRSELAILIKNPSADINRYHDIIDTWYGYSYSNPSMDIKDWILVGILITFVTPFIFIFMLRAAKPISSHISRLADAANSVSSGDFKARVNIPENIPSELVWLSDNFNEMASKLEQYERNLKTSHVALAHELRSPLTAAVGRLQGIIDGVFEPNEEQLKMILQQLIALNRLVDDLHILKLANAEQLNMNFLPINLNNIIREKISWVMPLAKKANITITLHESEHIDCSIDSYRMGQVFLILMDNAIRYGEDGGLLDIFCKVNDSKIVIIFKDNGPAVSDTILKDIFSPFVREDTSRSRNSGGSGLGLAIARAICVAHSGTITVEKNSDKGLSFYVTLPFLVQSPDNNSDF